MRADPEPDLDVLCLTMNPSVDLATETEEVVPTYKLRCSETAHNAGGGGINVARVLTRLGGRCTSLCPAGGPSGDWLRARMTQEGLAATVVPIAQETRVSFTVHERRSGAEYRFVMPGPHLDEAEWRAVLHQLEHQTPFPDLVVASGSLPPGVPDDFYARVARLCRQRGKGLLLDTSGPALAAALAEGVWLFKPNLRELAGLTGRALDTPAQWRAAARDVVARGQAEVVALTLGHQGALLATREGLWSAPALDIPVVSAVGAGDSFVGGLVWALQRGLSLTAAFTWAIAAGSAALLSVGTGLTRPDDARRLQPQVIVTRVA